MGREDAAGGGKPDTREAFAAQKGPIALGLDVNTSSLTSFSNRIF